MDYVADGGMRWRQKPAQLISDGLWNCPASGLRVECNSATSE